MHGAWAELWQGFLGHRENRVPSALWRCWRGCGRGFVYLLCFSRRYSLVFVLKVSWELILRSRGGSEFQTLVYIAVKCSVVYVIYWWFVVAYLVACLWMFETDV